MGSDDCRPRRSSKIVGMYSGISPRRWSSPLLTEALSLETLQDTTYVRLVHHPDQDVILRQMCNNIHRNAEEKLKESEERFSESEVSSCSKRSEKAWSWLKRPVNLYGRDVKETVQMAKSKSHNTWAWLGKPSADGFQFDPTKRWPQGW